MVKGEVTVEFFGVASFLERICIEIFFKEREALKLMLQKDFL